jgi:hypothetical protein
VQSAVGDREKLKFFEHAPVDHEVGVGALGRLRRRRDSRKSGKSSIHALWRRHCMHSCRLLGG